MSHEKPRQGIWRKQSGFYNDAIESGLTQRLTQRQQLILNGFFVDGKKVNEIGEMMGISGPRTSNIISYAIRRLNRLSEKNTQDQKTNIGDQILKILGDQPQEEINRLLYTREITPRQLQERLSEQLGIKQAALRGNLGRLGIAIPRGWRIDAPAYEEAKKRGLLTGLTPHQQQLLMLFFEKGMGVSKIAQQSESGITIQAVSEGIGNSILRIQKMIDKEDAIAAKQREKEQTHQQPSLNETKAYKNLFMAYQDFLTATMQIDRDIFPIEVFGTLKRLTTQEVTLQQIAHMTDEQLSGLLTQTTDKKWHLHAIRMALLNVGIVSPNATVPGYSEIYILFLPPRIIQALLRAGKTTLFDLQEWLKTSIHIRQIGPDARKMVQVAIDRLTEELIQWQQNQTSQE